MPASIARLLKEASTWLALSPVSERDALAEPDRDRATRALGRAAARARQLKRSAALVSAATLAVIAAFLYATPLITPVYAFLGLQQHALSTLYLLGGVTITARWGLRGALLCAALSLVLLMAVAGGIAAITGASAIAREALVLSLALNVTVPLVVGCLAFRLAGYSEVRRLSRENRRVTRGAEEVVRASEARFQSLIQNASDIVTILDANGIRRYVSPSVQRLLGSSPDELLGTSFFDDVHPDDVSRVVEHHLDRLANPLVSAPIEFRCRDKSGAWHHVEANFNNLLREPNVAGIVVNARDVTESVQFQDRLAHQAFHDPLTGLPNRALFMDRLGHALSRLDRSGSDLAVLFLDLDRFKVINDSLGHPAGDALLKTVGRTLLECVRPGDTVARIGGDEFAVLLADGEVADIAVGVAERIIDRFRQPISLMGHEVVSGTSIGIAMGDRQETRADALLQKADMALYSAKALGRGCFAVFDPAMSASAMERLDLESDLRHALDGDELHLVYQPEMDLATGAVASMEALVRWHHPRRGVISPGDFLHIAEETGLITVIGRWVLQEACRQAVFWQSLRPDARPTVMSVNVSARQLRQPGFVDEVAAVLHDTGLQPSLLRLEISETTAMLDAEATVLKLQALRQLGVGLAIDDFGTYYSSLSYLRRFAVDTVKVDPSFVHMLASDDGTSAIVQAVTTLAHVLGMTVTAEGIETAEHLASAQAIQFDRVQGFYCARPRPAQRSSEGRNEDPRRLEPTVSRSAPADSARLAG